MRFVGGLLVYTELWLIDFGGVIKFCCNCRDVIKCDSPTYFYFVRSCFCKNTTIIVHFSIVGTPTLSSSSCNFASCTVLV